ncbi:MAG: hypothetical protein HYZ09_01900 [Candidatus Kerfeldbacteria bacterium]|nr:hypothetical protein [Candidatus Kerfeldbacteria bacterium]
MFGKRRPSPRGFILLLGLLVVASVTAITAVLSRTVFRGIFIARQLNASLPAYFAAETGIERALLHVKDSRVLNQQLSTTITSVNTTMSRPPLADPQATYGVSAGPTESLVYGLDEDASVTIDFFNPDNLTAGAGVDALEIDALDATPAPDLNSPWLEVSYVEFTPGASLGLGSDAASTFISTDAANPVNTRLAVGTCGAGSCLPACLTPFATDKVYRVRIKALFDDATQVRITPYDGDNCSTAPADTIVPLQSRIVLTATGRYWGGTERVQQVVTASMNWLTPASPLFDYTLFSEATLEKR